MHTLNNISLCVYVVVSFTLSCAAHHSITVCYYAHFDCFFHFYLFLSYSFYQFYTSLIWTFRNLFKILLIKRTMPSLKTIKKTLNFQYAIEEFHIRFAFFSRWNVSHLCMRWIINSLVHNEVIFVPLQCSNIHILQLCHRFYYFHSIQRLDEKMYYNIYYLLALALQWAIAWGNITVIISNEWIKFVIIVGRE